MPARYPPVPIYPNNYDSTYTLFGVHNTVETVTTADNDAWSQEIQVKPVPVFDLDLYPDGYFTDSVTHQPGSPNEIWAYFDQNTQRLVDNGFATINGELLYYDSVGRENSFPWRVITLKNCIRNLGGSQTQFNPAGSDIRSFVIAEQHNQIAQAIIQIEQYLATLCLPTIPSCEEDGNCAQVSFQFTTSQDSTGCDSTDMVYQLNVSGAVDSFRLDFGDGSFTTVPTSGTHSYASGSAINPVVTASNDNCQVVVAGAEPTVVTPETTFEIPVVIPSFPDIIIPSVDVQSPDISIPPLVQPCIDLKPIDINVGPISIGDINIPSMIQVVIPSIPNISLIVPSIPNISMIIPSIPNVSMIIPTMSNISLIVPTLSNISLIGQCNLPSVISIVGAPNLTSVISIVGQCSLPTTITVVGGGGFTMPSVVSVVGCNLTSVISVVGGNLTSVISIVGGNLTSVISVVGISNISVVGLSNIWCSVIGLSNISLDCSCLNTAKVSLDCSCLNNAWVSIAWGTPPPCSCTVNVSCPSGSSFAMRSMLPDDAAWDDLGLPNLEVAYDVGGIPSKIAVEAPNIPAIQIDASSIPTKIVVEAPTLPDRISVTGLENMVSEIKVLMPETLPSISIDASGLPDSIPIDWGNVPTHIDLTVVNMPSVLSIEHNIPSTITVEGMVDTISLQGIPEFLPIRFDNPEDRILRVEPIDVKVTVDIDKIVTKDGEGHTCFYFVPCNT